MSRLLRNRVAGDRSSQDRAEGSDTGPTVSNVLPVSVDSGGPSTEQQSRRGATPLMATAEVEAAVPLALGRNGLRVINSGPSAASRQISQRMRWTKEMNISIMRAYYISTKVETECEGFRVRMHTEWRKMHPDSTLDEQRVCSQLNSIRRRKALSTAELDHIKQQVISELQQNVTPHTQHPDEEQSGEVELQEKSASESETGISAVNDQIASELLYSFEKYNIVFEGIPLEQRPRLPKITGNRKFYDVCKVMNTLLENSCSQATSLEELSKGVHCAALAVCTVMGKEIKNTEQQEHRALFKKHKSRSEFIPVWKKRIQDKINKARKEISHLLEYFNKEKNVTKKVQTGIRAIARRLKLRMNSRDLERRLREEDERLRQRIAALGARIRRYEEASKRRQQETTFFVDQKKFYRQLERDQDEEQGQFPDSECMVQYWTNIWAKPMQHNENAYWLQEEEEACGNIDEMPSVRVTLADIQEAIGRTQNWKSPGLDGIHNVWWKYFTVTHPSLVQLFNEALQHPDTLPSYLLAGITYMVAKSGDRSQPKNYRPITCLTTLYKILSSVISSKIHSHLISQDLLPAEQNGCRRGARGCKELLVIDSVITQQVRRRTHNLSVGWVDYKKAFDSVPHSWLIRVLKLYKINPTIVNFLSISMSEWKTSLHIRQGAHSYKTCDIRIRRGIFQGDSLSPLWFCIALSPLSRMIRESSYGYVVRRKPDVRISHQFYMDDLKLYASSKDQLQSELELVKRFSDDIYMEFGLDKCATLHVKRGQVQDQEQGLHLSGDTIIQNLGNEDTYKYLGLLQLLGISETNSRNRIQKKVISRVNKICKSCINSRNKISSINAWAIPVATYTFGVIKWTETSLQTFDRKIRTTLTKHRLHHPHSSVHRLYLPRNSAGRGLLNLETLCRQQEEKLREYFLSNDSPLHRAICTQDKDTSPLSLTQDHKQFTYLKPEDRINRWREKELHGRFISSLSSDIIDQKGSTEWLRTGGLYGETEGFLFAIQDQVMKTRAYRKFILGQQIDSRCRLCRTANESIQHICCGCPSLAQTEYLQRHNNVAKVIHQALAKRYRLTDVEQPYYKCKPEQVISNDQARLLWDCLITTDRTVEANRPDVVLLDKIARKAMIVDAAVPTDDKLVSTVAEKKRKYQPLAVELKDMYKLQAVEIIPVVVSANGLVTKDWQVAKEKLQLQDKHLQTMQKAALLGTANIVRKFLSLD